MIRRALAATVAASAAALATAAPAPAFVVGGNPWPYDVVTYTSATPAYSASIDRAAHLVNRQNLGVRLRRNDRYPDVTFVYNGRSCDGAAYVGYSRRRRDSTVYLGRGCSRDLITLTAVHELGHVLGLDHETRRCARMNPSFGRTGTPGQCPIRSLSYWLGHPFTSDDLRGLRALY